MSPTSSSLRADTARAFPWVVAHRGARDEAPDNTAAGFLAALHRGVDGVEFDVQLTRDGVAVVHHDRSIYRASGSRRRVAELELGELHALARGRGSHRGRRDAPFLPLADALRLLVGRTRLLVEIKWREADRRSGRGEEIVHRVLEDLRRGIPRRLRHTVLVLSFDAEVLRSVHAGAPHWQRVLSHRGEPPRGRDLRRLPPGLWGHAVPIARLGPEWIEFARRRGRRLLTWTVNGPRQLARARRLGVDVLLTDRPAWLVDNLRERVSAG